MVHFRGQVLAAVLFGACTAPLAAQDIKPLENAHAHNDYLHKRPLLDALDHGFTSIEADIFLVDGELLVGHDRNQLVPGKTLETLYLSPLAERVQRNGGRIYRNGWRFFLLIDIKSDADETYEHLEKLLAKYSGVVTTVENGMVRAGAITVVISGAQPRDRLMKADPRYAAFDGRISDLATSHPPDLMPMVSDKWTDHFKWSGTGAMPADERAKLNDIIEKAHAAGRVVRFWATPENESVWKELRSAGVDLINTDQLEHLSTFLRALQNE